MCDNVFAKDLGKSNICNKTGLSPCIFKSLFWFFIMEIGSQYLAQASLELSQGILEFVVLAPQPGKHWDYRCALPHQALCVFSRFLRRSLVPYGSVRKSSSVHQLCCKATMLLKPNIVWYLTNATEMSWSPEVKQDIAERTRIRLRWEG